MSVKIRRVSMATFLATGADVIAFPSAAEALAAAEAARATDPAARLAVHTGLAGRARRLFDVANPGQTLVSEVAAAAAPEVALHDLGLHRLRDLSPPQRVFALGEATPPRSLGRHPEQPSEPPDVVRGARGRAGRAAAARGRHPAAHHRRAGWRRQDAPDGAARGGAGRPLARWRVVGRAGGARRPAAGRGRGGDGGGRPGRPGAGRGGVAARAARSPAPRAVPRQLRARAGGGRRGGDLPAGLPRGDDPRDEPRAARPRGRDGVAAVAARPGGGAGAVPRAGGAGRARR